VMARYHYYFIERNIHTKIPNQSNNKSSK